MRCHLQPAYVLHHRPYRDTSQILELFTRDHGRVSVFARGSRGARRSSGPTVSTLQPFNRLLVSWTGQGEAGQLTAAEFDGGVFSMPADRLVSGFYLNELLLKLFAKHDSHPEVFALYSETIEALKRSADVLPRLRIFEKRLLEFLGYGLALDREAISGQALDPSAAYHYRIEQGPTRTHDVAEGPLIFTGAALLAIAREDFADARACSDARKLLRIALDRVLDGRELKSRQVLMDLRQNQKQQRNE
jgi:DNA repair protein RecO (recombination protein O)